MISQTTITKPSHLNATSALAEYMLISPSEGRNLAEQLSNCIDQVNRLQLDFPQTKIARCRAYFKAESALALQTIATSRSDCASIYPFPINWIAQAPHPNEIILELMIFRDSTVTVEYGNSRDCPFTRIESRNQIQYLVATPFLPYANTRNSANCAFEKLQDALGSLNLQCDQIERQWNYIGQIFQLDDRGHQYYQLFNEARNRFFQKNRHRPDFPAATGIGIAENGIQIESLAIIPKAAFQSVAINNPDQIRAYHYHQTALKGIPSSSCSQNQAPQFERARLLCNNQGYRLLVSGTAAIRGEQSMSPNDVILQIERTIANLDRLISPDNLCNYQPELRAISLHYRQLKVYVRNTEDIPTVKAICRARFGPVPTCIVQAAICRENLLVEIEAELYSRQLV